MVWYDDVYRETNAGLGKVRDFITDLFKFKNGGHVHSFRQHKKLSDVVSESARNLRNGGIVYEKGHPVGVKMKLNYTVKDVDSVPAILSPGEYVLTPKMVKDTRKAFKKAKMKKPLGL